jgi:hypothetical protein
MKIAANYPSALQAKAKAAAAARSDMFRNAVKMGVRISFGTDAAVFPHGQNAKEFITWQCNHISEFSFFYHGTEDVLFVMKEGRIIRQGPLGAQKTENTLPADVSTPAE